jgi:uroporphyrinogen-III synthase
LDTFNALMFVSANAVQQFFALQPRGQSPDRPRYWVTGPGSLGALLQAGVARGQVDAPDSAAAQFDSEALWQAVQQQVRPGWRVLIVRGDTGTYSGTDSASDNNATADSQGVGRDWLAARLTEQGAAVEFVVAYVRRAPQPSADTLALVQRAASDGTAWLFSSSEALGNLRAMAEGQSWSQARAVVTHPRIAQAARAAGFAVVCESRPALADLLASIESLA